MKCDQNRKDKRVSSKKSELKIYFFSDLGLVGSLTVCRGALLSLTGSWAAVDRGSLGGKDHAERSKTGNVALPAPPQ